jgi:hypothetical protein
MSLPSYTLDLITLKRGSPTQGPPGCIVRPAATFLNYAYTIKITQQFRGIPLIVIFARAAPEPAHNTRCGPLQ